MNSEIKKFHRESLYTEEFEKLDKLDKLAEVTAFYVLHPQELFEDLELSLEGITLDSILKDDLSKIIKASKPKEYEALFQSAIQLQLDSGYNYAYFEAIRKIDLAKFIDYFNLIHNKAIQLTELYNEKEGKTRLKKDNSVEYGIVPKAFSNVTVDTLQGQTLDDFLTDYCFRFEKNEEGKTIRGDMFREGYIIQKLYSAIVENNGQKDSEGFYSVYLGDLLRATKGENYHDYDVENLKRQIIEASKNMYQSQYQKKESPLLILKEFDLEEGTVRFQSSVLDVIVEATLRRGSEKQAEKLSKTTSQKKIQLIENTDYSHSKRVSLRLPEGYSGEFVLLADKTISTQRKGYVSHLKAETLINANKRFMDNLQKANSPRSFFQNGFEHFLPYLFKYYLLPEGEELSVNVKLNGKNLEPSGYEEVKHIETKKIIQIPKYPLPTLKNCSKYVYEFRIRKKKKAKKEA